MEAGEQRKNAIEAGDLVEEDSEDDELGAGTERDEVEEGLEEK